jgi:hypothetical protein
MFETLLKQPGFSKTIEIIGVRTKNVRVKVARKKIIEQIWLGQRLYGKMMLDKG